MEKTEIDHDPSLDTNFPQPPPSTTSTTTTTTDATTVAGRKRGRPRKYNSPEEAVAAKKLLLATKKQATANNSFLGNDSNGFSLKIINVTTGEDINHKIMSFVQQSKQEICVMSASGVVSSASIRRPDAWGSKITYRGSFDIISLCGSYVHADRESRTGGLSICMSSNEGQIVGGGVGGPLIAAGLVQVIVGIFVISSKKTVTNAVTDAVKDDDASVMASVPNAVTDNHASIVASVPSAVTDAVKDNDASVGPSIPDLGFPSVPDSNAGHSVLGDDSDYQYSNVGEILRDVNYLRSRHGDGIVNDLLREHIPILTFSGMRKERSWSMFEE